MILMVLSNVWRELQIPMNLIRAKMIWFNIELNKVISYKTSVCEYIEFAENAENNFIKYIKTIF